MTNSLFEFLNLNLSISMSMKKLNKFFIKSCEKRGKNKTKVSSLSPVSKHRITYSALKRTDSQVAEHFNTESVSVRAACMY